MTERGIDHAVYVLARGGLRADQTLQFITDRQHAIQAFQPTHVVVHVGHCDMASKRVDEMGKPLSAVLSNYKVLRDTIHRITPSAEFAISEMFPRALSLRSDLKDHDQKMRSYNRKIAQAAKHQYDLIAPVIYHPQFRLNIRAADPHYFMKNEGKFYGVHLNIPGNRSFAQDLIAYAFRWISICGHAIIYPDTVKCT